MSSRCLLCCVPLVQGDSMPTCDRITTESAVKAANAQLVVVIIPLKELVCCYALRERLANPTAHNKAGFGKQKKDLSFRPVLLSHFLLWTVQISSGTWIRTTTRGFKVLRPAIRRSPNAAPDAVRGRKRWCRGPDLNWGHRNFQSRALPTELPRQNDHFHYIPSGTARDFLKWPHGQTARRRHHGVHLRLGHHATRRPGS